MSQYLTPEIMRKHINTTHHNPTQNTTRRPLRRLAAALLALAAMLFAGLAAQAQVDRYYWGVTNGGAWDNLAPARWTHVEGVSTNLWPDGPGVIAEFTPPADKSRTFNVGASSKTIGILHFGDTNGVYAETLAQGTGGTGLIFDNNGAGALLSFPIASSSGGDTISCPIQLKDNLTIDTPQSAGTLVCFLTGAISETGGARSLTKTGTGKVQINGIYTYTGSTTVSNGTLILNEAYMDPGSSVYLVSGGTLQLNFSGENWINGLYTNGVALPDGSYDASSLPGFISGFSAVLHVGTPPATPSLQWAVGDAYWDDLYSPNWTNLNNSTTTNWVDGSDVLFNDNNTGLDPITVYLSTTVSPGSFVVSNVSKAYTIAGGDVNGLIGLSKFGSGKLTLTGDHTFIGATTVSAGTLQLGNGADTGSLSGNGDITNGSTVVFFHNNAPATRLIINNNISGAGSLTFMGTGNTSEGAFDLRGDNSSFTGTMIVDNARLQQNSLNAMSAASTIYATNNGTLFLNTANLALTNHFVLGGQGFPELVGGTNTYFGALRMGNITGIELSGNITLVADTMLSGPQSGYSATISGAISGNHNVDFKPAGTLVLTATNTYTGGTTISSGTVQMDHPCLDDAATLSIVGTNAVLNLTHGQTDLVGAFYTNGVALPNGNYPAGSLGGFLTGSGAIQIGGSVVNPNPTNLTYTVSGNVLTLSWPPTHTGWMLQWQTNSLGIGLSTNAADWHDVTSSTTTNQVVVTNTFTDPTVFYRLHLP